MWPRPNPGDAGSSNFDPAQFWIRGGPLFFGEDISAKVVSRRDMASVLYCHCEVQMNTADDDEIRQTVLYHLNMSHAYDEIKERDRLQLGPHQGWRSDLGLLRGQKGMEGLAPSSA